jgi:Kef-type K+ transport system membrane component KefB
MWLVRRQTSLGKTTKRMFAPVCVALLFSALVTERIGIHAIFGAFLLGAVVPHDSHLARDIREKCEDLVVVLLLPVISKVKMKQCCSIDNSEARQISDPTPRLLEK